MLNLSKFHKRDSKTLVIGLGGTGLKSGSYLHDMIQQLPIDEQGLFHFIFLDSDSEVPGRLPGSLHSNFHHFFYENLEEMRRGSYKDFAEQRFPKNLGRNPKMSTRDGAGATRAFGLASLVANRNLLEAALGQAIVALDYDSALRIFIFCSAAGGTGAGMAIDTAAMCRDWFADKRNAAPQIFLFAVTPDVFNSDPTTPASGEDEINRRIASGYAFLKDLNALARQGQEFRSYYHSERKQVILQMDRDNQRLFEAVHLFQEAGAWGAGHWGVEEACWSVAECAIHLASGEVGAQIASMMPNSRDIRAKLYPREFIPEVLARGDTKRALALNSQPCFVSSMGVASVRYPVQDVKDIFQCYWRWLTLRVLLDGVRLFKQPNPEREIASLLAIRSRSGQADPKFRAPDISVTAAGIKDLFEADAAAETEIDVFIESGQSIADLFRILGEETTPDEDRWSSIRKFQSDVARWKTALEDIEKGELPGWLSDRERDAERYFSGLNDVANPLVAALLRRACNSVDGDGFNAIRRAATFLERDMAREQSEPAVSWPSDKATAFENQILALVRRRGRALKRQDDDSTVQRLLGWLRKLRFVKSFESALNPGAEKARQDESARGFRSVAAAAKELREALLDTIPRAVQRARFARVRATKVEALRVLSDRLAALAGKLHHAAEAERAALARMLEGARHPAFETQTPRNLTNFSCHHVGTSLDALRAQQPLFQSEQQICEQAIEELATGVETVQGTFSLAKLELFGVEILRGAVRGALSKNEALLDRLADLDNGWTLPGLRSLLEVEAAEKLDEWASPLLRVKISNQNLVPTSWIIAPADLNLPEPFTRGMQDARRLVGERKDTITAVRLVSGVSVVSLEKLDDMFNAYFSHISDLTPSDAVADHGKYALHIWRDAALDFEEPFQPLVLAEAGEAFDKALFDLAGVLPNVLSSDDQNWKVSGYEVFLSETLMKRVRADIDDYERTLDRRDIRALRRFRLALCERIRRSKRSSEPFARELEKHLASLSRPTVLEPLIVYVERGDERRDETSEQPSARHDEPREAGEPGHDLLTGEGVRDKYKGDIDREDDK